ncbi:unnamed protein product [Symbiodinium sp. CCMP2592]|nr:unnamed protein product [Symbiodinium sp. CCMP2592]
MRRQTSGRLQYHDSQLTIAYDPAASIKPLEASGRNCQACAHSCFDGLREEQPPLPDSSGSRPVRSDARPAKALQLFCQPARVPGSGLRIARPGKDFSVV